MKKLDVSQLKIARGCMQSSWWWRMRNAECPSATRELKGRAKRYGDRYAASFANMMQRAQRAGFIIERVAGPRGGEWGATYKVIDRV